MSKSLSKIAASALALLLATGLGLYLARPVEFQSPSVASSELQLPAVERPFWEEASPPDHLASDAPAQVILSPQRGLAIHRDYAAEVHALESGGDPRQLNDSLLLWFGQSPKEATDWINQTERFADLVPNLGALALSIAGQGQLETALAWVEAIPDEAIRHDARLRLYAQQARRRLVSKEDLQTIGFTSDDIATILGGALGD